MIDKKDYEGAKRIIAEGIKVAERNDHPGTVYQWQKELLRIAVLEKDIGIIRKYTKSFAFDRYFSREFYNQFKKTYNKKE